MESVIDFYCIEKNSPVWKEEQKKFGSLVSWPYWKITSYDESFKSVVNVGCHRQILHFSKTELLLY